MALLTKMVDHVIMKTCKMPPLVIDMLLEWSVLLLRSIDYTRDFVCKTRWMCWDLNVRNWNLLRNSSCYQRCWDYNADCVLRRMWLQIRRIGRRYLQCMRHMHGLGASVPLSRAFMGCRLIWGLWYSDEKSLHGFLEQVQLLLHICI